MASKTLVNKLKQLMSDLITPFQNAFVKDKMIIDNILIAGEILHHMKKTKGQKKTFWGGLKIDIHKAFDRVSWEFLNISILEAPLSEPQNNARATGVESWQGGPNQYK